MESRMQIDTAGSKRKRGRPAGKNRMPLSAEERRARNAQYERERRSENSEAMCELANAVGCDFNKPNADILASVVSFLSRRAHPSDSIDTLKRRNEELLGQIAELERRLGVTSEESSSSEAQDSDSYSSRSSYDYGADVRTHDNAVGCKRIKMEEIHYVSDSDESLLLAAMDSVSSAHLEDESSRLDGVPNMPLEVSSPQCCLRNLSIEDLILEYL